MAKIWTTPRVWEVAEPITDDKLNEISQSLEWLKDRPRSVVSVRTSTYTFNLSTTVWQAISDAAMTLQITTAVNNEDVVFYFNASASMAAANGVVSYDILVDDTNYVSSGTPTPLANGFRITHFPATSGQLFDVFWMKKWTVPVAGTHTFKLRVIGNSAVSSSWYSAATLEIEFGVLDI